MASLLKNTTPTFFEYVNRGEQRCLVLLPGWATDYRIFNILNLKFNYILPVNLPTEKFDKNLLGYLKKNNFRKVSFFGWSMGGFLAASFALNYADFVDELILVSIRKKYEQEKLREIKTLIRKNKKAYLYKFYNQCFSDKTQMSWFKKNLLNLYSDNFNLKDLCRQLDYLENAKIHPQMLSCIKKIKIIHGEQDSIAPVGEALDIKNHLPQAVFICIKNAGHI